MEPIDAARLFRPPRVVEFVEYRAFGEVPMGRAAVRQTWTPLGDGAYEVEEYEQTPEGPRWREGWRVRLEADGRVVHLGGVPRAGAFDPWEPPFVVLPARVAVGPVATGVHARNGREVERSSEILPSTIPNGFAVVSDTRGGPVRIVMRDHYVVDFGWAGFEGLVLKPNGQLRVWSEDVVVDGVPAPAPPEETDA